MWELWRFQIDTWEMDLHGDYAKDDPGIADPMWGDWNKMIWTDELRMGTTYSDHWPSLLIVMVWRAK